MVRIAIKDVKSLMDEALLRMGHTSAGDRAIICEAILYGEIYCVMISLVMVVMQ